MYAHFFGLKQEPFSIAPDPRYLFMSERHREALAHLLYGVRGGGGFVLLSGEIGAGKTTVCRCFLEQIPKRCNVAYIFNPKLTVEELLKTVCDEFRIPIVHAGPGMPTVKDYVDALNDFLLRTHAVGQNNVLIIDEAQNLSPDVLEQLRLLTNLETSERKLLQIVLIGQPELRSMLARPELEQLNQRVIARFHLEALSASESEQYIRHRWGVAGAGGPLPFDRRALQRIHRLSRGVPRRINLLCDRALLGAYATGKATIDRRIVDRAAQEVFGSAELDSAPVKRRPARLELAMIGGAAVLALGVIVLATGRKATPMVASAAVTASAPASASGWKPARAAPVATTAPRAEAAAVVADAASAPAWFRTEKEAWRALAAAWQQPLEEGEPCTAAQRVQLHCFRSNGSSLAQIRQLDRPGVLTLHEGGRTSYAVLTSLGPQGATLQGADGLAHRLPIASLAGLWQGDYATFWRAPPAYGERLSGGDAAPLNDWLARKLPAAQGEAAPLKDRIAAFQLAQGLKPDGRAGPITMMQLNRSAGIEEPRLQSER